MLIYGGMEEPALSVDVFTGVGTSAELLQPSTDLICGEPCTVYVKYTLASGLVPLSGEIFAVSFSDFAVIPVLCLPTRSCSFVSVPPVGIRHVRRCTYAHSAALYINFSDIYIFLLSVHSAFP